jgi:hypothetical protein
VHDEQLKTEQNKTLWLVWGILATSALNIFIFLALGLDLGWTLSAIALLFYGIGGCFWLISLGVNRWSRFNYVWFNVGNCVGWITLAAIFVIIGFNIEALVVALMALLLMGLSLVGERQKNE